LSANKIAINANSNSPTVLYVASEGKVGINTEYPNKALSVNGSVEITGITTTNNPAVLCVTSEGRVGINTEYPNKAFSVNGSVEIAGITTTNSDVEITDSTKGIILRSPNNNRWRITVTNSGTLSVAAL
jgi:hypothetical protein